jgi:hypothetical protein
MSLIKKTVADKVDMKRSPAKFDLISLSNLRMDTFGIGDSRLTFEEGRKRINIQAKLAIVPDVVFNPSVAILIGMDILKPLGTTISMNPFTITLSKKGTTLINALHDVRGIRTKDETAAAVAALLYRCMTKDDAFQTLKDIFARSAEFFEVPNIEGTVQNVETPKEVTPFPELYDFEDMEEGEY